MYAQSSNHPAEVRRRSLIAAGLAVMLAVAMLAVAPTPATADGSTPPGTTKVMTASDGSTGFGLSLGDTVTISFDDGKIPEGNFFDTWLCAGVTHAPRDDAPEEDEEAAEEAGCFPFLFWFREDDALSMSFRFGLEDSDAYPNSDLSGTPFGVGMPGLLSWLFEPGEDETNAEILGLDDACDLNGLYFIVHDFGGGDHSNFLGPLSGIPCSSTPVGETAAEPVYVPPVMVCTPDPVVPGGTVTCELSNGPVDHEALWRASFGGSVFASTGVRFGSDGTGSFSFVAPRGASCGSVTVELVEWLPPMTVGVACAASPARVPAGEGGLPVGAGLLGLVGVAGAVLVGRRLVTAG